MSTDHEEIEELLRSWAAAVHRGDLAAVLDRHTEDIVMFDVPPPGRGPRGLAAYRDTWPPFFEWQRSGAVFEFVELEITCGVVVGYATALLRCGTPEELERDPENLLRLTVGLKRVDGRWQVAHEHHSFATP